MKFAWYKLAVVFNIWSLIQNQLASIFNIGSIHINMDRSHDKSRITIEVNYLWCIILNKDAIYKVTKMFYKQKIYYASIVTYKMFEKKRKTVHEEKKQESTHLNHLKHI